MKQIDGRAGRRAENKSPDVRGKHAKPVIRIKAEAFNKSIEAALRNPPDSKASAARVNRAISALPEGKLFTSDHGKTVSLYMIIDGHQKYVQKKDRIVYPLARKTYLLQLKEILELTGSEKPADVRRRKKLIGKLQKLISTYERAYLDIARIVLTSRQYNWLMADFEQKRIDKAKAIETACGILVRSRSERDIVNNCEKLAVPLHYEERQFIYVKPLVDELENELREKGLLNRPLYSYVNGIIHWNVPPALESMNTRGSIWMSYYPPTGTIKIFNDFRIMLADGTFFIWEHEGMIASCLYRIHASERSTVMKYTETVEKENLLETYERDIDSPEKLIDIIERSVLPRLWF